MENDEKKQGGEESTEDQNTGEEKETNSTDKDTNLDGSDDQGDQGADGGDDSGTDSVPTPPVKTDGEPKTREERREEARAQNRK